MIKFKQTDKVYKDIVMNGEKQTIKKYGCLLIACNNIINEYGKIFITPKKIDTYLDLHKGYTKGGYILWSVLEKKYCFKHKKIMPSNFDSIVFSNRDNIFWIVQVNYKDTGHFCQVVSVAGDIIVYFDSYDGEERTVYKKNCLSIRELTF